MPPKAIVRTNADILQACHDRLDQIALEERAAWQAWAANPGHNGPPQMNAATQLEVDSIHATIARMHELIAREEEDGGNED